MKSFNIYTNNEILDDIEEYEEKFEGEDESERAYTLEFYNFMIGGGPKVVQYYRNFDHLLLTEEQAQECLSDALFDLIDLVEEAGNEVFQFELGPNEATAEMWIEGHEYTYTACIDVCRVDEAYEHTTPDVVNIDSYWEKVA